jgi:allophanate hydrolase
MSSAPASLDIATLTSNYRSSSCRPGDVVELVLERIAARGDDKVWIHRLPADEIRRAAKAVQAAGPEGKPLYGIPFAIKDNIDLAAHPTTAGCPDYAFTPQDSAPVVAALIRAGAIPIGKTNLDQFATGLVGTRSPYGAPANSFNPAYISGGSSSGSAVAVAAGLVSFALGTDTAGSGRVPAAFNNLIGVKPSCGLLSGRGVVPACRSLDCVSIFALTAEDAAAVLAVAQGYDRDDPFSRDAAAAVASVPIPGDFAHCRIGVPRDADLDFFGNGEGARLFGEAVGLVRGLGAAVIEIDFTPFLETARLLYEGPWVAERYAAIRNFIEHQPQSLYPVTRQIIEGGAKPRAADAFAAYYRLKALRRKTEPYWRDIDLILAPTAGRCYTIAEVLAEPVKLNSNLGYYTNFVNLLDLSAIAVPAGMQRDGLPFGVTLVAPAFQDCALLSLGRQMQRAQNLPLGATDRRLPPGELPAGRASMAHVRLAVFGAHMAGLALNHELADIGARLVRADRTAPRYRLFALADVSPPRPGLMRSEPGTAIDLEIWEVPVAKFGGFVAQIPPPLTIGKVELADGERIAGFLCEGYATAGARDISELGGWRRYLGTAPVE